jgi:hypothetical protein
MFGGLCVLSLAYRYAVCMWVTVQYAILLSHCLIAICFLPSAVCYVLVTCFMIFYYLFYVCFLVLYAFLTVLRVLCFCIVSPLLCIYFLFVYNITDHRQINCKPNYN